MASWSGVRAVIAAAVAAGRAGRRGRRRAGRHDVPAERAGGSPARKLWIAFASQVDGVGHRRRRRPGGRWSSAARSCCRPASRASAGAFGEGDTVDVRDTDGIACRPRAWCSVDAATLAQVRRQAHQRPPGGTSSTRSIHRDDLVAPRRD